MQEKIWDPLRKKYVSLTPEEKVRQWFITVLRDTCAVPEHMMMSEAGMKFGEMFHKKEFRADILIYGPGLSNLAIVECKQPDVELTNDVLLQAMRYDMVLSAKFIFITNGRKTFAFKKENGEYKPLTNLPTYKQMLLITENK